MSAGDYRPRRSVLYMPGANERALEKAKALPADAIILDLEDAVAPDAKDEARERVCAAVGSGEYGHRDENAFVDAGGAADGEGRQDKAEDLRARVSQDERRRGQVKGQEAQSGTGETDTQERHCRVAGVGGDGCDGRGSEDANARRDAVLAVDQVHGVREEDHPEQRRRPGGHRPS